MSEKTANRIRIADFSEFPGGRFRSNGPNSGEEFRESVLSRYLDDDKPVVIDFDGVFTVAPSFLEEAFGPAMTQLGREAFQKKFQMVATEDPDILNDLRLIQEARFRKK